MVTVSTLESPIRSYHHGDLRSALIDAGIKALETAGEAEVPLRQLAREVGVSATAVYRHFPDKRALLVALADEGLQRLGAAQRQAAEAVGDSGGAFAATGRAYVRFALAHPALFRLVFTHADFAGGPLSSDDEASRMLFANARALTGGDPAASRRLVLQAWAVVHGLAMLMLDARIPADDAIIDAVIDAQSLFPR